MRCRQPAPPRTRSEDEATKATETIAQTDQRFAKIDTDLAVLERVVGFTLAGVSGLFVRMLTQP